MRTGREPIDLMTGQPELNIYSEIRALQPSFDLVALVNPFDNAILDAEKVSLKPLKKSCTEMCPLAKDKCGCICKDVLSTWTEKGRFTFDKKSAFFVMCRPIKLKYRDYVLLMVKRLDPNFSFGAYDSNIAVDKITSLSSTLVLDALTNIFNRKYLSDNIEYQIRESLNKHKPLSIACIDIDNFKKFNDSYGHDFGDKVLKAVAECMEKSIEGFDEAYPVRIGGDEFMVIGVGIPKAKFKVIMTKLCQIVQATKLPYKKEKVGICISIGVSELLEDKLNNYREMYDKADKQLYAAKEAGKNCVR